MKIAFVNDSCERLGVEYISAVLKANIYQVKLFVDPQLFDDVYIYFKSLSRIFDYKNKIIDELKVYKPDLIGISTDTESYQWACQMARMIKKEMDVPIIFGGIHSTSVPERVIKNEFVDMVCVGEGEYPMLELANSLEKGSIDYSIRNIWFKKNGSIIQNEVRPLIEDLDSLPFADHNVYYEASPHFRKGYFIAASRGCPYSCTYCYNSCLRELYKGNGKYLRQRSVNKVIQELIYAKEKYKINRIMFVDDCFGNNINWLREFCYEYKDKVSIKFFCVMHPEDISSESVSYLKEAGCNEINLGIQSWNENLRAYLLNRRISNDVMKEAIGLIKKQKIFLAVDNIFGFSTQDNEGFLQSILPYTSLKPNRIFFFKLRYYPNTAITKRAKEEGWLGPEKIEELLDGRVNDRLYLNSVYFNSSGQKKEKIDTESIKIQILLILLDCFPPKVSNYIIKNKLYRYFPTILNPAVFALFRIIFSFDLGTRIFLVRALICYSYFIRKKVAHTMPKFNFLTFVGINNG